MILSIDVETFGKVATYPPQTQFHPLKIWALDGLHPSRSLITCALTTPKESPCQTPPPSQSCPTSSSTPRTTDKSSPSPPPTSLAPSSSPASSVYSSTLCPSASAFPWAPAWFPITALQLSQLRPGNTQVLQFADQPPARTALSETILLAWLNQATVLIGHNLTFDLMILRAWSPRLRAALSGRHFYLDTSILNFLHSEGRPEKSLKDLGPILGTHLYNEGEKARRYPTSSHPDLHSYNAQDTHNTMLCAGELSTRILTEFPHTDKLSPFCLRFYSDLIRSVLRMSESGVPYDLPSLHRRFHRLLFATTQLAARSALRGLHLEGKGSTKSQSAFLQTLLDDLSPNHPSLAITLTDKTKQIQSTDSNRTTFGSVLPLSDPRHTDLRNWGRFKQYQKLLSTYLYPILLHKRNDPTTRTSLLLSSTPVPTPAPAPLDRRVPGDHQPLPPHAYIAYPSWFLTPSPFKDNSSSVGGTQQSRITCKESSEQTTPPQIQACRRSRFRGGTLLSWDLDQAELRTAGLLSGEPALLDAFEQKWDLHSRRALSIFGLPLLLSKYPMIRDQPVELWKKLSSNFDDLERAVGKTNNFADLFRSGADVQQAQVHEDTGLWLPIELFRLAVSRRALDRPVLWAWQNRLIADARRDGYLALPFTGQSRSFLGGTKFDENEIVNFPVQATASNVLLRLQHFISLHLPSMALATSLHSTHLCTNTYDALLLDCSSPSVVSETRQLLTDALTWITTQDYWAALQSLYGRTCPLTASLKEIPNP